MADQTKEPKTEQNTPLEITASNVLAFSVGHEVYIFDIDNITHKVAERVLPIQALCSHAGRLYDSSCNIGPFAGLADALGSKSQNDKYGRVLETIIGREVAGVSRGLFSQGGKLYRLADGDLYPSATKVQCCIIQL